MINQLVVEETKLTTSPQDIENIFQAYILFLDDMEKDINNSTNDEIIKRKKFFFDSLEIALDWCDSHEDTSLSPIEKKLQKYLYYKLDKVATILLKRVGIKMFQ